MTPDRLVGREEAIATVRSLIDADTPVVVVGEGGMGKSALLTVLQIADRSRFVGGGLATLAAHRLVALARAIPDLDLDGDDIAVATRIADAVGDGVLIVDDVHDADAASLSVLEQLAGGIAVLAAARPDRPGSEGPVARLVAAGYVAVALGSLHPDDARTLVQQHGPELSEVEVNSVLRGAHGVPLLLEVLAEGHGRTSELRAVLPALDSLSPDLRDAALLVAAAGRPVRTPDELSDDDADALVDHGIALRLDHAVTERHALISDALLEAASPEQRATTFHRLAALCPDLAARARLLRDAGEADEAYRVMCAAVESADDERGRALLRGEAVSLGVACGAEGVADFPALVLGAAESLHRAGELPAHAELMETVTASVVSNHWPPADRAALALQRSRAAHTAGNVEQQLVEIERGLSIDDHVGSVAVPELLTARVRARLLTSEQVTRADEDDLARAEFLSDPASHSHVAVLSTRALVSFYRGEPDAGDLFLRAALEARRCGDVISELRAANNAISCGEASGDQETALALARDYVQRARLVSAGDWATQFQNLEANLLYHRGEYADSLAVLDAIDSGPLTRRTAEFSFQTRAQCYVDLGLFDEAIGALDVLADSDFTSSAGTDALLRALVELGRGDPGAAYTQTLDTGTEGTVVWPMVAAVRAWSAAELGWTVDTELWDAPLLPITVPIASELEAWSHWTSDPARAADLLAHAARESRRWSVPQALRQEWAAGEAARRAGLPDAVDQLNAVETEALARGMAPLVVRARKSLRAAGVARTSERGVDRTGLVTLREREVLDLVARGRSNAEIARRLGVSRPTVRRLLENARAKLGARDRIEAAAILAGATG